MFCHFRNILWTCNEALNILNVPEDMAMLNHATGVNGGNEGGTIID